MRQIKKVNWTYEGWQGTQAHRARAFEGHQTWANATARRARGRSSDDRPPCFCIWPRARGPSDGMGAKTIEIKSSHLSLISHPQQVTDLILQAAGRP